MTLRRYFYDSKVSVGVVHEYSNDSPRCKCNVLTGIVTSSILIVQELEDLWYESCRIRVSHPVAVRIFLEMEAYFPGIIWPLYEVVKAPYVKHSVY